jgi:hypothetical protein
VKALVRIPRFLYDFVVGDDWTVALGAVAALGVTALAAHQGLRAWWILPVAVAGLLGWSVARVARR